MTIAIGIYLKLKTSQGTESNYRWQNFFKGETRRYDNSDYSYGGFGFSGGTLDLEAGNIQASLVFDLNTISLSVFEQAAREFWIAEIRTVWLDPVTFAEGSEHSQEVYAITGFSHDNSRLQVQLGSPLDAVSVNVPRRVLTTSLVGNLPSSGQINLS